MRPNDPGPTCTLLDGPMGTELERRGIALPPPAWTAAALVDAPEAVASIHRAYALAGAQVHTAATFRTTARALAGAPTGWQWQDLARRAVRLCRDNAGRDARVAGSLAPLEDCYRPDLTPGPEALHDEHGALADCLAEAGCDLLLVETMPTLRELELAVRAAAATGLPVWAAVTLGPDGSFFDSGGLREAQAMAAGAGAEAFLINCSAPETITRRLAELDPEAPPGTLGAYGNLVFGPSIRWPPARYAAEALAWKRAGATLLGGCCGTTPEHLRTLHEALVRTSGGFFPT